MQVEKPLLLAVYVGDSRSHEASSLLSGGCRSPSNILLSPQVRRSGSVSTPQTNPHTRASGLHPRTRMAGGRYGCESAAVAEGTVVLVKAERLPRGERRRKPKALWTWCNGLGEPDLNLLVWRAYCRRFDVEHFVKYLKETLGWTTPRVRHPEQADRWTWLVLAAYAQLLLARRIVSDHRLPWERPLPTLKLTPTRISRNSVSLLPVLGAPARAPKPRGRSPGRPKSSLSGPGQASPGREEGRLNRSKRDFDTLMDLDCDLHLPS